VLSLPAGRATIIPNFDEGEAGYHIVPDPNFCLSEWEKRGKVREPDAVWHARMMASMAGAEVEAELLGSTALGDDDDRYQIELMAGHLGRSTNWERLEPRLRKTTWMLVRRHKERIGRVAKALLARSTLTAKQLDKLVGRCVDDVKVNAPFLLLMAESDDRRC
jgi:hypothetical protein